MISATFDSGCQPSIQVFTCLFLQLTRSTTLATSGMFNSLSCANLKATSAAAEVYFALKEALLQGVSINRRHLPKGGFNRGLNRGMVKQTAQPCRLSSKANS